MAQESNFSRTITSASGTSASAFSANGKAMRGPANPPHPFINIPNAVTTIVVSAYDVPNSEVLYLGPELDSGEMPILNRPRAMSSSAPLSEDQIRNDAQRLAVQRLLGQLLDSKDIAYVEMLRTHETLGDLDDEEFLRIASAVADTNEDAARRLDLLLAYYDDAGDPGRSFDRRLADRFFAHQRDDLATAAQIVARVSEIVPEIGLPELDRVGEDGPLVLRANGQICALDEDEDDDIQHETVSVRAIVGAVNTLLSRQGLKKRLVPLWFDETREAYLGLSLQAVCELHNQSFLDDDLEATIAFARW